MNGRSNLVASRFKIVRQLGEGTFGVTYLAQDCREKRYVALKKVRIRNAGDGLDYNTIQEIRQLSELSHPNILQYIGTYVHQGNIYIASEYLLTSLTKLIDAAGETHIILSPGDVKSIMHGILSGIEYLHENWLLHRDIKPDNILLSESGVVKLIDFGLSTDYPPDFGDMIDQVITTWYKPPELLYGSNCYGPAVDIWSIGCVFAEMLLRHPFLQGQGDDGQLQIITDVFGEPLWPGCDKLPKFRRTSPRNPIVSLKMRFPSVKDDAIDLLAKFFTIDPSKRITASEALQHPYFVCQPPATLPSKLPLPKESESIAAGKLTTGLMTSTTSLMSRSFYAPGTTLMKKRELQTQKTQQQS